MSPGLVVRRGLVTCATLILLGLAWWSLAGALRQLPRTDTFGQHVETVVQVACGLLSLAAALTRFHWRRWGAWVRTTWAASLVATVGLSALVWGPPMLLVAALFAAVAWLAARAVIWALGKSLAADAIPDEGNHRPREMTPP